jgi:hypothetical protein
MKKKITQNTTFIYTIEDENGIVRYVGKSNDPKNRLHGHLKEAKGTHKYNWLHSIIDRGFFPVVKIIDEVPFVGWEPYEIKWIAKYRELGYNLVNVSDGGMGPVGSKHSEKSKEIMGKYRIGIPLTEEHKEKISNGVKEKAVVNPNYNKCQDKTYIINRDELYQKYITENLSINECVEYFKIPQTTIYRNLVEFEIKKDKEIWKKQCTNKTSSKGKILPRKTVLQFDLDGNLIAEHNGLVEAAKYINAPNPSNISQCCLGKKSKTNGFVWKYKI